MRHRLSKFVRLLLYAVIAFALTAPAQARWHKAEADNFVIYADDSARDIERFAIMLERYHAAMDFVLVRQTPAPSPSSRVTIFAVGSERDMRRLSGGSKRIAGFYIPRASGSMAFVQDIRLSYRQLDFSMIILLLEYAHHHLMAGANFSWPKWVNEGAAEFFASAQFPRDGGVEIGLAAQHRGYELLVIDDVPIRELLSPDSFPERNDDEHNAFYGRAWLLYHYLTFDDVRKGQLSDYLRDIAAGTTSLEAAETAFGDLDALNDDMDAYLRQRRILSFNLKPEWLDAGNVTVSALSDGMDEVMPLMIQSRRGVTRDEATELLPEIRKVAAEFPHDAGVLEALAEAEYDAGNDAEAIAAADRALAINPQAKNAYVQKGYALFRMAGDAESDDMSAAYSAALKPFQDLNRLENNHPLPLIYFYRSYVEQDKEPTELARTALEHASTLAPFDHGLALNVATMQASEGKIALSRMFLQRVAANPHRSGTTMLAESFLGQLDEREEGTPVTLSYIEIPDVVLPDADGDEDSEQVLTARHSADDRAEDAAQSAAARGRCTLALSAACGLLGHIARDCHGEDREHLFQHAFIQPCHGRDFTCH